MLAGKQYGALPEKQQSGCCRERLLVSSRTTDGARQKGSDPAVILVIGAGPAWTA
jgi:hypothetical protein